MTTPPEASLQRFGLARWRPWLEPVLLGLLPGLLAGSQLAVLLFFLNPGVPFSFVPFLQGTLVYGGVLAVPALALSLPWTWGRPARARRLLPWGLTIALGLAAALHWTHASRFAFYLPAGINSRLIKAALILSGGALILFYTALLHSFQRRPYGSRSRLGFVLVCLTSVLVAAERRAAFEPRDERHRPIPLRVGQSSPSPRLLVVGVEGLTLEAVLPLAEQGRLPFLAEVLRSGSATRVTALTPNRRLPAWTTLATGRHPYGHAVMTARVFPAPALGHGAELHLLPAGIAFPSWGLFGAEPRPVSRRDQRALPLWQLLGRLGWDSGIVGWPAPGPLSPDLQLGLSAAFFEGASGPEDARPEALAERAMLFRPLVEELDNVVRGRFGEDSPRVVRSALAQDAWRHSLTLFLLEQEPRTQALFLFLPGLSHVSRETFGGFLTAQLQGGEGAEARRAAEILAAYYRQVDTYLGELWARSGPQTLLAVVSPAGFTKPGGARGLWGELVGTPEERGTQAGAPDGALFLIGPGVRQGGRVEVGSVVDVVPTLLHTLGLPLARDLDGKVLADALDPQWRAGQPLSFVPTYESLPPRSAR